MKRFFPYLIFTTTLIGSALAGAQAAPSPAQAPSSSSRGAAQSSAAAPQQRTKLLIDVDETLFEVLSAINACGFNLEFQEGDNVRSKVRAEIREITQASSAADADLQRFCAFYKEKESPDPAKNLAQWVSLGLNLTSPPEFAFKVREADLPPDAQQVMGAAPHLQKLHTSLRLDRLWAKHINEYGEAIVRLREPLERTITETDQYLRLVQGQNSNRAFVMYIELMGAARQVNARNYGTDYYMVVTPTGQTANFSQIRHTYLHYIFDPMLLKRASSMKKLEPVLDELSRAPMDQSYKDDIVLLTTESLIRAVEARLMGAGAPRPKDKKAAEAAERTLDAARNEYVQSSVQQGFVLTRYFANRLRDFEKEDAGIEATITELLYNINVDAERSLARNVTFDKQASGDVVRASRPVPPQVLDLAKKRLAEGDPRDARRLAQQAFDQGTQPDLALFILARAATMTGAMDQAIEYFERTLNTTKQPELTAWSHIYLGRIFDLRAQNEDGTLDQPMRERALSHYHAALEVPGATSEMTGAAQRGVEKPYEPPADRKKR